MSPVLRLTRILLPCLLLFAACSKDGSLEEPEEETGTGNGNGTGNTNGNCNTVTKKLKKYQSLNDPTQYIEVTWNADKSIQSIKMNTLLSEHLTAKYVHGTDGKIKEAILLDHRKNDAVYDTAVFHYNAANKVDSMYLKNRNNFDIALGYSNNKLVRYTRYSAGQVWFYWDIKTDNQDNITNAVCYFDDGANGFKKESTYTWTRDDKKNPFSGLAPYMMYLDGDFEIFWYWGANNFVDQRYQDHTGLGIDITSGHKFKYNNNCYPESTQSTISGQVIFTDPDFSFTYY